MRPVLFTLILLDLAAFAWTATGGALLESPDSLRHHFLWGVITTILFTFTHLLVLFYLIGTEGDIKEAVGGRSELLRFVERAKRLKLSAFPAGCVAVLLAIIAALLGGEVHSRLLVQAPPSEPPALREVTAWWIHLAFVVLSFGAHFWAFAREVHVTGANRRLIDELNGLLEAEPNAA